MEILINPKTQVMKRGQKYHLVLSAPKVVPMGLFTLLMGKIVESRTGGKARIYNLKIDNQTREVHVYIEIMGEDSPVIIIIASILGLSALWLVGLTLKQTYLVLAEGIPNLSIFALIGLGGYFLIKKWR